MIKKYMNLKQFIYWRKISKQRKNYKIQYNKCVVFVIFILYKRIF